MIEWELLFLPWHGYWLIILLLQNLGIKYSIEITCRKILVYSNYKNQPATPISLLHLILYGSEVPIHITSLDQVVHCVSSLLLSLNGLTVPFYSFRTYAATVVVCLTWSVLKKT